MSAFFVSPETVADTVSVLVEYGTNLPTHNRKQLGKALWRMNAKALAERYGDDDVTEYEPQIEAFASPKASPDKWQRVHSARCFRYQCSEGDVPETELFKLVDTAIESALESLGGDMRFEFDRCLWDRS